MITVESCLGSGRSGLISLKVVKSPFLRPGSTLATRLEAFLLAIAEPLSKNTGKVDWVWMKGTPYHHGDNMVRRVAALCPGWSFSLHYHSEMGCALMKSEATDSFNPKLHRQVQFAGNFSDLKRKWRIFKFSLENFLVTLKPWDKRKKLLADAAGPAGCSPVLRAHPALGQGQSHAGHLGSPLIHGVLLEIRECTFLEIQSISKWKYTGNCFKMQEFEFWTANPLIKKIC